MHRRDLAQIPSLAIVTGASYEIEVIVRALGGFSYGSDFDHQIRAAQRADLISVL